MEQRVIKIFPYSYSSLTSFEICARKHHGEKLTKEFARPFNKAADDGDKWHKEAEEFAKEGKPIPETNPHKAKMEDVLVECKDLGELFAERELAVTKERQPCGWWDAECYTRAKLDILYVGEKEATSIDWKTGRADVHSTQLQHSSMLLLLHYPNLEKVHCRYEWLKEGFHTKRTYHRDFLEEYWNNFEKRVARYKKTFDKGVWEPTQNFLCKSYKKNDNKPYCGVTTCEFYGK